MLVKLRNSLGKLARRGRQLRLAIRRHCTTIDEWPFPTYFEIAVNNALTVHIVDGLEDLLDQVCGVLFGVAALFDDPVEEFAAVNAVVVVVVV